MCGICGILATSDAFARDESLVEAMRDSIRHRGPDDAGTWRSPRRAVALGHRRLSIVDLSPAGHQPMPNEDGTVWITYNGEVYNHEALRAELEAKGHSYPLAHRHRGDPPPLRGGGADGASSASTACSRSRSGTSGAASCSSPATGSASSRSTTRSLPGRLRLRLRDQGAARAPGVSRRPRRGGVLPLPDVRLHARRRGRCSRESRSCAPAERLIVAADGSMTSEHLLDAVLAASVDGRGRAMSEEELE